jgi:hypothetical protein
VGKDTSHQRLNFAKFNLLLAGSEKDMPRMTETANKIHRYGIVTPLVFSDEKDLSRKLESLGDTCFQIIGLSGNDAARDIVLEWIGKRETEVSNEPNDSHLLIARSMPGLNEIEADTPKPEPAKPDPKPIPKPTVKPVLPRNKSLSVIPLVKEENGPEWVAAFAAVISAYGQIEPARPFQTLPVLKTSYKDLSFKQKTDLLDQRYCAWSIEDGMLKIARIVTTDFNENDFNYRDLNHKLTLSFIRNDLKQFIKVRFPRHMLSEDPRSQGEVVTPSVLKGYIVDRHKLWLSHNLCQDPKDEFTQNLDVKIDADHPGKVNISMSVYLMGQLIQTYTKLYFRV